MRAARRGGAGAGPDAWIRAVYEQEFRDCSYSFRPNRSAHQALDALWKTLTEMKGGWVLEVDIKGFFDSLNDGHLRGFLDQRVRDGVLRCRRVA